MKYLKRFNENDKSEEELELLSDEYDKFVENVEGLLVELTDDGRVTFKTDYYDGFYQAILFNFDGDIKKDELIPILETIKELMDIKFEDMGLGVECSNERAVRNLDDLKESNIKIVSNLNLIFVI